MTVSSKTPDLERPLLDLSVSHFTRIKHGIRVQGIWLREDDDPSGWEPSLALTRAATFKLNSDEKDSNVCLVTMRQAWAWTEENEYERQFAPHLIAEKGRICARSCYLFALNLGMTAHNQFTLIKILSVVRDHIGDLLHMPPAPPLDKVVVADAVAIGSDGIERRAEIVDYAS